MKPSRVMTIAGSSSGGSAGIQADLKTFQEFDVHGMSVVTAIVGRHPETDQNVHPQTIETIEAQFSSAWRQVGVDGVKIGMLFSEEIIRTIATLVQELPDTHLVVDPVMVGKLDSKLLKDDAIEALKTELIPLATVITPNIPEASYLLDGRTIQTVDEMAEAAIDLYELGATYVLLKGGRLAGPAVDIFYDGESMTLFEAPRIENKNTSGAGCSYSAAIAAGLAKGRPIRKAVETAKRFVTASIEYGFTYTGMVGPTYLAAYRTRKKSHKVQVKPYHQK